MWREHAGKTGILNHTLPQNPSCWFLAESLSTKDKGRCELWVPRMMLSTGVQCFFHPLRRGRCFLPLAREGTGT